MEVVLVITAIELALKGMEWMLQSVVSELHFKLVFTSIGLHQFDTCYKRVAIKFIVKIVLKKSLSLNNKLWWHCHTYKKRKISEWRLRWSTGHPVWIQKHCTILWCKLLFFLINGQIIYPRLYKCLSLSKIYIRHIYPSYISFCSLFFSIFENTW